MDLSDRIELLGLLGDYLQGPVDEELTAIMYRAWAENKWFTTDQVNHALQGISSEMLDRQALRTWAGKYEISEHALPTKAIGIVMAGNIPLVGFSDWLAVFVSGQRAIVKLSDKDNVLLPYLVQLMGKWMPQSRAYTHFLSEDERLADFDAVIATGSNNTSRYFEQYFSKYPHIIRKNRTSVAVLDGSETGDDIKNLALDIYAYFGLGCRNVSKIFLPKGTDVQQLCDNLNHYAYFAHHDKYRNNYDYNTTLYILNQIPFFANPSLILKEDALLHSRISCVHFAFYSNISEVSAELQSIQNELQCVVSKPNDQLYMSTVDFGKTQLPGLLDYPDGEDVMAWIAGL